MQGMHAFRRALLSLLLPVYFYPFFPQRRKIPFIIFAPFKLKPLHESFQIWRRISK